MSDTYSLRRVLTVLAALALPAATCGVAPALQDLMQRMQRVENFIASAQLPPVLIDDRGALVGQVLEYSDVMLYASVPWWEGHATERQPASALATVLFQVPNLPPIPLEANRDELLTPIHRPTESFYFESTDCSGTPWIDGPTKSQEFYEKELAGSAFGYGRIFPPGQVLYTADLDAPGQFVRVRSRLRVTRYSLYSTIELPACEIRPGGRNNMLPLEAAFDLEAFRPPFRIMDQRELWLH